MRRLSVGLALGVTLAARGAEAQSPSYFVTTVNGDTTSVETLTRTGNAITGDWITKQGAVLHHYVLALDAAGLPARYELTLSRLGPATPFKLSHFVITYAADSATIVTSGDSTFTRCVAAKQPYPLLGTSAAGVILAVERLRATHVDSGSIGVILPTQPTPPFALAYRSLGPDSASVGGPGGNLIAKIDANGRVLDLRVGPSDIRRVPSLDIARFKKVFAAADSAELARLAARKEITVPAERLERLVGEYTFGPGRVLTITRDGDRLISQLTGQSAIPLAAESPTTFFPRTVSAELEFESDSVGKVVAVTLSQGSARQKAPRTKSLAAHPDFTGAWVMDSAKSQLSDPNLVALKLSVSSRADTFVAVSDGTDARNGAKVDFSTVMRAALDGRPTENTMPGPIGRLIAVLKWEGAIMTVVLSGDSNGNPVTITQRWSLDASGSALTRRQDLAFAGRTISEALVFTRQVSARQ